MQVHVGCSGWFYWHWRGIFYPDTKRTDSWFKHYTSTFNTVELNAPFYSWPKLSTVKSWRRNAPEGFRYSVKVNRLITHEKRLVHTRMLVEEFYGIEKILEEKLGCFLFQFPPSYRYTPSRLASILRQLNPQYCNAVEFRHKSWWRESVYRRFRARGLSFCTVSAPRLPDDLIRTSDVIYARLHGRSRWYRHDYTDEELKEWADKIAASGAREAWIYFDNDREGFAIKNARELTRQLGRRGLEVVSVAEKIAIIGGGAAGFFAAIACARANPANEVSIYERGSEFLTKVRISGGGRCNVAHACFDPRALSERYPRGERALISPLHRFSPSDTVAWFEERGVRLKTEADGRMFPVTDSSQTIIDCLVNEAKAASVRLFTRSAVDRVRSASPRGFELSFERGEVVACDRLLLATGGSRLPAGAQIAKSLGHTVTPPVPSLFSFHVAAPWLRLLPGVSVQDVEASVSGTPLRERGALLITHNGVSGPAILRLSAWGARILHGVDYEFVLRVNWLPELKDEQIRGQLQALRESNPNRRVANSPIAPLPVRLWEQLALSAGIDRETRWTTLSRAKANELQRLLTRTELQVNGKSLNKEEFVTCGGVNLREIDFKTMESRITPGLYFAGELLDLDGITGGFNFQAAWTTGWIAGHAMAEPR